MGITDLLRMLRSRVEEHRRAEQEAVTDDEIDGLPIIGLSDDQLADAWRVEREDGAFRVYGEKIEKFARRTNFDQYEAVNRLRDIMRKHGISHEIIRQDGTGESLVRIGDSEFTLIEQ